MSVLSVSCPARVGLVGNPSDGFGGKTLSFAIDNFSATVTIEERTPEQGISLQETLRFHDGEDIVTQTHATGYNGGLKLLQATCKVFFELVKKNQLKIASKGFLMTFSSTIPRMVGLSGSSALIIAAFRALLQYYDVSLAHLDIIAHDLPEVILGIETRELSIAAGLQDRVIQCLGGTVFMDFSHRPFVYESIDSKLLPPLYLAYNVRAGGDSGKVHSTVRDRWLAKDPEVISGMHVLAGYAEQARDSILKSDFAQLGRLMDLNFSMRRKLYSDSVVGEENIMVVEHLQRLGFCAKFSGSGGAIICLRAEEPYELTMKEELQVRQELLLQGFEFIRISVHRS